MRVTLFDLSTPVCCGVVRNEPFLRRTSAVRGAARKMSRRRERARSSSRADTVFSRSRHDPRGCDDGRLNAAAPAKLTEAEGDDETTTAEKQGVVH